MVQNEKASNYYNLLNKMAKLESEFNKLVKIKIFFRLIVLVN